MTAQLDLKPPRPPQRSVQGTLEFAFERPSECAREVDGLARRFAAELGRPPYEVDWERVFSLERASIAGMWTARHQTILVGYLGFTVNRGLFTSEPYTRIEAGYLAPEWREGLNGVRFIARFIAGMYSVPIEWETNDAFAPDANGRSRLATLLVRLGFRQVGTVMRREP